MKKENTKKEPEKKISPYVVFNNWLFDNNKTSVLDESCINSLSCFSIMQLFSGLGNFTIFLNEYFNDLYIHQVPKEEFFKFLKEIVMKKKITKKDLCFIKYFKDDANITKVWLKLPYLKRHEIPLFLEELEDEERESLEEMLGISVPKKKKLTKKDKEQISRTKKDVESYKMKNNETKVNLSTLKQEFFN